MLQQEILAHMLRIYEANITVEFRQLPLPIEEMFQMRCVVALQRIKEILEDEALKDEECFQKIEEIIGVYERLGSGVIGRHDFG